jgi:molecular chaperone DnaK
MESPSPRIPVGIDLGTSTCVLAGINRLGRSEILLDEYGQSRTKSAVHFAAEGYQVGQEAIIASTLDVAGFVESPKRDLGSEFSQTVVRDQRIPPEVLQACILRHLKKTIDRYAMGHEGCVLGVPAFFDQIRREKTRQAADMAGLELVDLINEPTAAALAYGEFHGYLDRNRNLRQGMEHRLLVYDLGGGTFDVTVMEWTASEIRTLGTDGDVQLGGNDWDQRLYDYLVQKFESRYRIDVRDDPASALRLRRHAREIKESLSARQFIRVDFEAAGSRLALDLSREQFELLTSDLVERTAHTVRELVDRCRLKFSDIHRVLVIGGASRMPAIRSMLHSLTGQIPDQSVNADEAVARGAAIRAATRLPSTVHCSPVSTVRIQDVATHSLGIEGIELRTERKENRILIPRDTPLPTSVATPFATRRENQETVVIRILEGESLLPSECVTIGHAVLDHLPAGLRKGHPLQVVFVLSDEGNLEVRLCIQGQPDEWKMRLERSSDQSSQNVRAWKQWLSGPARFVTFEEVLQQTLGLDKR